MNCKRKKLIERSDGHNSSELLSFSQLCLRLLVMTSANIISREIAQHADAELLNLASADGHSGSGTVTRTGEHAHGERDVGPSQIQSIAMLL